MKALLRRLVGLAVSDYRVNWIYAADAPSALPLAPGDELRAVDADLCEQLARSDTPKVANSLSYERAGLEGLVILRDDRPLCVAHFARPAQYDRAGTWPLDADKVALMDIATEEAARGQGLAPAMIAAATRRYLGAFSSAAESPRWRMSVGEAENAARPNPGARRMIAFIWWSNTPSVRAFVKAGWRRIGISLEWCDGTRWRHLHLRLPG
jgi:RimJ/RimL family protein N-acetyltransferase